MYLCLMYIASREYIGYLTFCIESKKKCASYPCQLVECYSAYIQDQNKHFLYSPVYIIVVYTYIQSLLSGAVTTAIYIYHGDCLFLFSHSVAVSNRCALAFLRTLKDLFSVCRFRSQ